MTTEDVANKRRYARVPPMDSGDEPLPMIKRGPFSMPMGGPFSTPIDTHVGKRKPKALPKRGVLVLMLPPPSAATAGSGVASPVEAPEAEAQADEGRYPLPGDAHDAARLKGRKPKGPRR